MSNITAIDKVGGGWKYTLLSAPACGWDIWLHGTRLESRYSSTVYILYMATEKPPPIEVADPNTYTPSLSTTCQTVLQWWDIGANIYVVERSNDGINYYRVGQVQSDGNVVHHYAIDTADYPTYWKVYAAEEVAQGIYEIMYAVPFDVFAEGFPKVPSVKIEPYGLDGSNFVLKISNRGGQ